MLLLAACADATAVGPGSAALPRSELDEDDLVGMIPAEADLVLWADMAKLRASPWTRDSFAKVAEASRPADPDIDQIRDVERLVFAKLPSLRDGASLLVAQGRIDREQMGKAFAKGQAAVETSRYRGADLLTRAEEALAFVGRRTVVSGLAVAVRAAIDCSFGLARTIESEAWFRRMRGEILRGRDATSMVTLLFVHLQPATREVLKREMGEGDTLEDFAGRIDLGDDLEAMAVGAVRTRAEARDLAARLSERIRDARMRPIVSAFGFSSVLDSVEFQAKEDRVVGRLHVSQKERATIAERMAVVAETMAKLRQGRENERP
ncbi:MAG: hypothetical protein JXP73_10435 [Deltaproteobacteria bacterium]|nr:hypothetical protein [Deltaproteobacteria bacterium]